MIGMGALQFGILINLMLSKKAHSLFISMGFALLTSLTKVGNILRHMLFVFLCLLSLSNENVACYSCFQSFCYAFS